MKRERLNKVIGFLAIGLIFGFLMLISWLFNKTDQTIEGPYIFYYGDTIKSLTINITGNKLEETYKALNPISEEAVIVKMQLPEGQYVSFNKQEKIEIPKDQYPAKQKILAISDVEGDFSFLEENLKTNGVIDDQYNWTFGKGSLVVVGDIFDRGKYVTECLWLLYKLENEAKKKGGQVHIILGNHEIMALQGDHRYVNRKYKKITRQLETDYKDLYGANTEIGRWLRSKNAMEIIGRILFVHGGVSPELINKKQTVSQINNVVRKNIDDNKSLKDSIDNFVMGSKGPLWYRGYIEDPINGEAMKKVLNQLDIDKVVIGHTIVKEITALYDHKVYAIDAERTNKICKALLIEGDSYYTTTSHGNKIKL